MPFSKYSSRLLDVQPQLWMSSPQTGQGEASTSPPVLTVGDA